jgi:anaerobic magnesium-protoporphyrin IX monomethyl ester cyclase
MKVALIRYHDKGSLNSRLPVSLNMVRGELPPLGISYIASVLEEAGHIVKILDISALNLTVDEFCQEINNFEPELVGVTTTTSTLFGALEAAKIAKEAGAITVLGGPQLSVYPKETLSYSYVDYGINGEGEFVMLELINALEKKMPPDNIKGLIYKNNDEVYVNEPAIIEDIDSLPFPAYHLLPMKRYDSIIGLYPTSTMISTRGCPYKCHFCSKQPSDIKFRFRSPKNVVNEMEYLVEKFKIREIMFYDDVMTSCRSHVVGICEEILYRNLKIKWETPARVDNVDNGLLELMHRAGCIRLRYGVESGDEDILKLMDKKIELKEVRRVFKLTKKTGIETFAYFMIGYAHETEVTIRKTIGFALELNPDIVMFTAVTPYPQTPLYKLAMQEGLIKNDYWREFTLGNIKAQRIPYFLPDIERWIKKAYSSFYFRPKYVIKKLNQIRSLYDFIKCLKGTQGILCMK